MNKVLFCILGLVITSSFLIGCQSKDKIFAIGSPDDKDPAYILTHVNSVVNANISYNVNMAAPRGKWKVWPKEGACGDYTWTKRYELIKAGYSPWRLKTPVCKTPRNNWHTYLLVDNKWVLDNRFEYVLEYRDIDCVEKGI